MIKNEEIAEYVKEERPEILQSPHFLWWRIKRFKRKILDYYAELMHESEEENESSVK